MMGSESESKEGRRIYARQSGWIRTGILESIDARATDAILYIHTLNIYYYNIRFRGGTSVGWAVSTSSILSLVMWS